MKCKFSEKKYKDGLKLFWRFKDLFDPQRLRSDREDYDLAKAVCYRRDLNLQRFDNFYQADQYDDLTDYTHSLLLDD